MERSGLPRLTRRHSSRFVGVEKSFITYRSTRFEGFENHFLKVNNDLGKIGKRFKASHDAHLQGIKWILTRLSLYLHLCDVPSGFRKFKHF